MSPKVEDPAFRAVTFDELATAYEEQTLALLEGGVDVLLVETIFDTLNAKAAFAGIEDAFEAAGTRVPIMFSGTITDQSGRTLSGQTVEAFYTSLSHANFLSVGLNCALGAEMMREHITALSKISSSFVSLYPNAGLPNEMGEYDETPAFMARVLEDYARAGFLNIVGGCCGTTPAHIKAFADALRDVKPRVKPLLENRPRYSGLEMFEILPATNFVNVGERTNITGSPKFSKAILEIGRAHV